MKLSALFVMLMAVLALFAGAGSAAPQPDPKVNWNALRKTGKTIQKIVSAVSVAATVHEVIQSFKNKKTQGLVKVPITDKKGHFQKLTPERDSYKNLKNA